MSKTTTRWGLPYPELTDVPDVPAHFKALAQSLDGVAMDDQGVVASRPTSTTGTPGKKGRYYYATDTGAVYRDTGTSWAPVNRPTVLGKASTAEKTYNASIEEVPGTSQTFTLATKSILWISLYADYMHTSVSTDQTSFRAWAYLDGTKLNPGITWRYSDQVGNSYNNGQFELSLHGTVVAEVASGEHTLAMKARIANNVGSNYKTLVAEGGTSAVTEGTGWKALVLPA